MSIRAQASPDSGRFLAGGPFHRSRGRSQRERRAKPVINIEGAVTAVEDGRAAPEDGRAAPSFMWMMAAILSMTSIRRVIENANGSRSVTVTLSRISSTAPAADGAKVSRNLTSPIREPLVGVIDCLPETEQSLEIARRFLPDHTATPDGLRDVQRARTEYARSQTVPRWN